MWPAGVQLKTEKTTGFFEHFSRSTDQLHDHGSAFPQHGSREKHTDDVCQCHDVHYCVGYLL